MELTEAQKIWNILISLHEDLMERFLALPYSCRLEIAHIFTEMFERGVNWNEIVKTAREEVK